MKKKIFLVLIGIALIGGVYYLRLRNLERSQSGSVTEKTQSNQSVILYVGATCPHCKEVKEWLKQNPKVEERSGLVIKEVYYNRRNARELGQRARECQIETKRGVAVPFLYDRGQCLIGDKPIIDYLNEHYN